MFTPVWKTSQVYIYIYIDLFIDLYIYLFMYLFMYLFIYYLAFLVCVLAQRFDPYDSSKPDGCKANLIHLASKARVSQSYISHQPCLYFSY